MILFQALDNSLLAEGAAFFIAAGGVVVGLKMFGKQLEGQSMDIRHLTDKVDNIDDRLATIDSAMARAEERLRSHDERTKNLAERFEKLVGRLGG